MLALCSRAGAFVYYADTNNEAIGRAGLAGGSPLDPFGVLGGLEAFPCGVAINGRYVYWGSKLYGEIGRAPIDGQGKADPNFIVGVTAPCGLAVYGGHLYWGNRGTAGSIGRANLTGPLDVQENFVPSEQGSGRDDLDEPCGLAVDSTGIYWTNEIGGAVGYANPDGTGERTLIPGGSGQGCGIAVGGGYLYWASNPWVGAASIGRALESGVGADSRYITGLNSPCGLTLYSRYLYFADGATIDRTDLTSSNPTAATEQIVLGTRFACGTAVDGLYTGWLTVLSRYPSPRGSVRLMISVSDPGVVVIRQASRSVDLLRAARVTLNRAGRATIILRRTSTAPSWLRHHRSIGVRLQIVYTPAGGLATTKILSLRLPRS